MVQELGADPKLWLTNTAKMVGFSPGTVQKYVADGLVREMQPAAVQRGRNIFGKQSLVQLLLAKSLVESGMDRGEIVKFMKWFDKARASVWVYPKVPTGYEWRGGNPDEVENYLHSYDIKFDPLPPVDTADTRWMRGEGYPRPPSKNEEWPRYWSEMKQLLTVDQYRKGGASAYMVLFPKSMVHSHARHASYVRKWCSKVVGYSALEPLVMGGEHDTITLHFVDLAPLKSKVGGVILNPPEEVKQSIGESGGSDMNQQNRKVGQDSTGQTR